MVSLNLSLSRTPSASSSLSDGHRRSGDSRNSDGFVQLERPASAESSSLHSSSSTLSLSKADTEDLTIMPGKSITNGNPIALQSSDNLRHLAISTHMTELSYSMSDIQTRIFEIQELRHQSQSSQDASPSSSSGIIDQALINLDERLEALSNGMKTVNDNLQPLIESSPLDAEDEDGVAALIRKHESLVAEWESVQGDAEVLREELKEDKWLTVFRTVSEQADGMMSSLEKAVQRCQDFIWRAQKRAASAEESPRSSFSGSPSRHSQRKAPLTYETFLTLQDSFEAKKKHYMPATNKVLSIIDKGVQDRVTKNGECLRRHAESTQRWKSLREKITRTDSEMEKVRRLFLAEQEDETESVMSERTSSKSSGLRSNSHGLATPPSEGSRGRAQNAMGTLSRSISPFRKFARKLGSKVGRATPTQSPSPAVKAIPLTDPVPAPKLRKRQSLFPLRNPAPQTETPIRPAHKYSQSFAPESPSSSMQRRQSEASSTLSRSSKQSGPKWNSSTKVEDEGVRTLKKKPSLNSMRAVSSPFGSYVPPVPPLPGQNHPRPSSRSSLASSRPWSPITASQGSTTRSSLNMSRPPSRASPGSSSGVRPSTIRSRASAPAAPIPAPAFWRSATSGASETSFDDEDSTQSTSLMQRLSPTHSTMTNGALYPPRSKTPGGTEVPYARPPSRSMIPVPKFSFSSASRPSSAMSDYDDNRRPDTSMSFRSSANRAQTPESALKMRVSQLPFLFSPGDVSPTKQSPGVSPQTLSVTLRRISSRLPPSSFRDSSGAPIPSTSGHSQSRSVSSNSRPASRSSSRAGGTYTPSADSSMAMTIKKYVVQNPNDPLDVEVAAIVNGLQPHGLLVERVDPHMPARAAPPNENDEVKAQYAFSNQLSRKVVTCRLQTMGRSGGSAGKKKVMCRVGGGWQDLSIYILNRQAGM